MRESREGGSRVRDFALARCQAASRFAIAETFDGELRARRLQPTYAIDSLNASARLQQLSNCGRIAGDCRVVERRVEKR